MSNFVQDRIVFVTGANRGIGKAILEGAIRRGASKVYAAVRDPASVQPLVDQHGDKVVPIRVDLQDPATIAAAAQAAGDAEVVINNAGIARAADILSPESLEVYEQEHQTNVLGWLRIAQSFAPVLKRNGGGALVQLNSVASLRSFADFATYCASKAASYSFTQAIRDKLAEQGTLVVSVHPGPIKTDMADSLGLGDDAEPPEKVADAIFDALDERRFHVFPDTMAQQFQQAYEGFANEFVEAEVMEDA